MKKLVICSVLALLVSGLAFSEKHINANVGLSSEFQNYSDSLERIVNGIDLDFAFRYLPIPYVGFFAGAGIDAIYGGDNGEYMNLYGGSGINVTDDSYYGFMFNAKTGVALGLPIGKRIAIQSDLGINLGFGYEGITGKIHYKDYRSDIAIFNTIFNVELLGNIFARFGFDSRSRHNIQAGVRLNYIISRSESATVTTGDYTAKGAVITDDFSGIRVTPFVGYLFRF